MQKGNTGLKNFFDVKTSKIEEDIRNLISQYPEYSLGVKEALASVTEVKPYGDIFVATQMARDLINAGLMQEHLNGSVRFRNKFVMQTLQNLLNK